ncbi:hypothetical protein OOK31_12985 [Streptomyces sp. NBC_00249]|uniref:hypothetical protein n=1 Tax=Streptomyces sp. NBC_00249 TaxID=2975690 RepID=UPI0022529EA0|nr:hypothetical protein [Streptomyces sp. NBC_00249]MCX5194802.1 hypothetical protein [Streptomyces sp. NBC_00249]
MARHASPTPPKRLRSAGLTLSMAGAALAMAAGGAQAGELDIPAALAGVTDPISNLKVNPLAHTGVDPLDNGVATKVADFPSVGTGKVTGILTQGPSVGELPMAAASSLLGPVLPK